MAENDTNSVKHLVTIEARLSFPSLFTPTRFGNQEPKYSATLNFGKITPEFRARLMAAAKAAAVEKWGANMPPNLKLPLRDGADKEHLGPGFVAGETYIVCNGKKAPGLVDQQVQPIIDERQLYAGCYVRCSITAFAYDTNGNKGVAFGLNNLQKMRDGTPLGGQKRPQDEFTAVDPGPVPEGAGDGRGAEALFGGGQAPAGAAPKADMFS